MPSPSTSLATLRPDLGESLMEFDYAMNRRGYIGHRVLPIINVMQAAGTFGKIPLEQLLKEAATERSSKSGYNRGQWDFTTDTFSTQEHGFEEPVDDRDAAIYADYFDAELISAEMALDVVLRNAEKRVADAVFNATTFSSYTTAITHEWDDLSNAVPITDVEAAAQAVFDQCGMWPNAVIMSRKVFRNCRRTDQVTSAIESAGAGSPSDAGSITEQMLAQAFDIDHVIVGGSARNSATEGQTASIAEIWSGEYVMVARVAETDSIKEPCIGRTFHFAGDGSDPLGLVETYRDEASRADIVRVRHEVQEKMLTVQCGHLLSNATT